ncbi:sigma-E processing peptidase SpoIIGA [Alicyclobacillus mengziensis]|uniref:Sigma-E processing peptidase SpoIIGA n=1 Tax=Alicyclobacillus mengziensis TaxID=2931921 RepID=A0A9X7Z7U5_9BACL|nr:sigma-E processing peptidase SpoIIGA [Alicyclobacillus mengziensis]QSO49474.1 sigma-E processing peptidase SpoIIGA [Alicyclobacillus mengziensis]
MYYTVTIAARGDAVPVIYADVVFLVNLLMDGVIVIATGMIVKRPIRPWRVLAGAAFGAAYAMLLFVPPLSILTSWLGKALASLVMVIIAVPFRGLLDIARNVIVLYCVTFVMAGAVLALHFAAPGMSLAQGTIISGGRIAFETSASGLGIVAAIPLAIWVLNSAIGRARGLRHRAKSLFPVTARLDEREMSCIGLLDTGNQLHDPLSKYPVCLVDAVVFQELVPEPMKELCRQGTDLLAAITTLEDDLELPKLYWVPFRGAGGGQKLTIAIRPDELWVTQEDGNRVLARPCLLALHMEPLSVDARFQAILHTEILAGDDRHDRNASIEKSGHETSNSFTASVDSHPAKG